MYKWSGYMMAAVVFGTGLLFTHVHYLTIILSLCGLFIASLLVTSYVKYSDHKKGLTWGNLTYKDALQQEIKHNYVIPLILSVFLGLSLVLSSTSIVIALLYSIGIFTLGVMLSAYTKRMHRKI